MTSGVRINWGPHVGDVSGRVLAVAASPRECGAVGGRGGWARPRGARTFFFLVDSRGTRRGRDVPTARGRWDHHRCGPRKAGPSD
jgi:hypothetical protein